MYFVRKVSRDANAFYQNIDMLALCVFILVMKLRPYFQGHKILIKTNYHVRQVLKKSDLVWNMVSWAVKLSECDIQYFPRGSIKSQDLEDFVVELSSTVDEETSTEWRVIYR